MRIGYGFDSHEFRSGIPLKIGGIALAHDKGLGGHSDGDVLLHAITDALLGAVAAPDIGALFPPIRPEVEGCGFGSLSARGAETRARRGIRRGESRRQPDSGCS